MSKIKLLTFDVTDTLLKFRMSAGEAYARTARLYGIEVEPSQLNEAFKVQWKAHRKLHPNFGAHHGLTSRQWWRELVKRTFHQSGCVNATDKQIALISGHLFSDYCTNACWDVYPGAQDILERFKKKGLTMGVISNFDERLENLLITMGLRKYFCFVIPSYLVKHEKPSREIFDTALNQVQHLGVMPMNAAHVGDNFELDYLAAKNAGWKAFWLCQEKVDQNCLKQINQNEVISHLSELENHILDEQFE